MTDPSGYSSEDLASQAKKHLSSLREAGLEWLPFAEMPVQNYESVSPDDPEATTPEGLFVADLLEEQKNQPAIPQEQRKQELILLQEQVAKCSRCSELFASRTQTVFARGHIDPEICFVGEAPGYNEDKQGLPFVGEAGQLLDRIISACGFQPEEVYICNILKCRPPGNRTPLVHEADNCREFLERQLDLVRPKFLCALGACAAQNLLGTTQSIGRMRKRVHDYNGIPVMCTYHPAYLLRNPEKKRDVWDDMKMLLAEMGRPVPEKK